MTKWVPLLRLAPLLLMAAIYYSSSQSGGGPAPVDSARLVLDWLHNLLHVPAYALLAASWCLALPQRQSWPGALLIFALTVGYGVLDEWHQSFVPGRQCSAGDLLLDAVGAGLGIRLSNRMLLRLRPPTPVGGSLASDRATVLSR